MKTGTLSERYLKRSVLSNVSTNKSKDGILVGPGVGHDFSLTADGMVTADGFGYSVLSAWHKAMNNFACSLGEPAYVRLTLLLPEKVKDSHIKRYMSELAELSDESGVSILGGNTQVTDSISRAAFAITVIGKTDIKLNRKNITSDAQLVFAGFAGIGGTNLLIEDNREALYKRFSENYILGAEFKKDELSVLNAVNVIKAEKNRSPKNLEDNIFYIHDVSDGGIYTALWQLGENLNKGFMIDNQKIQIRQETIEICEFMDLNPYLIDGTGGLLMVCRDGYSIAELLSGAGVMAEVIGEFTDSREKRVQIAENDIRTLAPEM